MSGQLKTFRAAPAGPTNEELVAEAENRLKAALPDFDAMEARVVSTVITKALETKDAHIKSGFWRGMALGTVMGLAIAAIFMAAFTTIMTRASSEAVGFGAVLGRAEQDQEKLREIAP